MALAYTALFYVRRNTRSGSPHGKDRCGFRHGHIALLGLLAWLLCAPVQAQAPPAEDVASRESSLSPLQSRLENSEKQLHESRQRRAELEDHLQRLNRDYNLLKEQLTSIITDVSPQLAELLRDRRDRITRAVDIEQLLGKVNRQIADARLQLLQFEDTFGLVADAGQDNGGKPFLQAQILENWEENVDTLEALRDLILEGGSTLAMYQELLDQYLFWLPSVDTFGLSTLDNLAESVAWFLNELRPSSLAELIRETPYSDKVNAALVFCVFIFLIGLRRRCKSTLHQVAPSIGNVGKDKFNLTLIVLLATVLLALPWSALLVSVGLLLSGMSNFGDSLSSGFYRMAALMFLLSLLSHTCRPKGLGETHFRWREQTLALVRYATRGLIIVLLPATLVIALTESGGAEAYRGSLGRVAFVAVSVALAYFGHYILRSRRADAATPKSRKLIELAHILAIALPVITMGLSLLGFHYTGVAIQGTLFISVCWILLVMLGFYLTLRGVAVSERRLTLARLREQRAAAQEHHEFREAAEAAGEGIPTTLDIPQMDLDDISAQARALVAMVAAIAIGIGLWLLWSNVFPAFSVLNDVVLWTVSGTDAETLATVTLQGLALAVIIAFFMVFAARNLPGMLEVAFLSRLDLAPGTGYAITTICRYLIVIVGTTIALGMLGAEWSKLQWLVAALGVGLGFGLQEIVANFISGIIILFERPMRVGDTVTVGTETGTVSRIRIRATTITGWDRKELIIPNKTFVTEQLTNWTLSDAVTRVIVKVGVAFATDVDQAQQILEEVATANPRVISDPPPAVFCMAVGDSRLEFEIRVFVDNILDYLPLIHEMHSQAIRALRSAGIAIPLPQLDMHIKTAPEIIYRRDESHKPGSKQ